MKQLRVQRNAALKTLRRTKQLKEEQAAKLTELSVGFESMVLVRAVLLAETLAPDPRARPPEDMHNPISQDPQRNPKNLARLLYTHYWLKTVLRGTSIQRGVWC